MFPDLFRISLEQTHFLFLLCPFGAPGSNGGAPDIAGAKLLAE